MIDSNMQDELTTGCKKTQAKKLPSKKTPARKVPGVTVAIEPDAHQLLQDARERDGRFIGRIASDCIRRVLGGAK